MAQMSRKKCISSSDFLLHYDVIRKICLLLIAIVPGISIASVDETLDNSNSDYIFDPSLFKGGAFDQSSLERLRLSGSIAPGEYKVDVYVNQNFLGNYSVSYMAEKDQVLPCLSSALIKDIGFKNTEGFVLNNATQCLFLSQIEPQASSKIDLSALKMTIIVPQALLNVRPRGYVSPDSYETGSSMGFINYLANYYHVSYSGKNTSDMDSAWLSLNGGVNIGSWQYRQLSTATWNQQNGSQWTNIRSYIQRPLPAMNSQLMGGQLVTNGRFFSGLSYNGINLSTADAMLPDSMHGYAPVIKGIASSNAKVSVRQNGQEIYQTTVPPGNFEINDLYPTSYSGDLQVQVTEADGTVKTFIVPFSAVPESMRPGTSRYNLALGRTRNTLKESAFGDFIYQRGLTNAITANSGLRFSRNYIALVAGGVHTSFLGAFGLDATFSRAKLNGTQTTEGWMTHVAWSKTFQPTETTVSLAGYRYSTSGYRELSEVLGAQEYSNDGINQSNYTSAQRSRFDITLSQSLGEYGNAYISGATYNYRNGRSRDTQLQLGYSQTFSHNINMNISIARQRVGNNENSGNIETATAVSFSIPLFDNDSRGINLSTTYNHSNSGGDQYQTSASGMLGSEQNTSYSVNVMRDQQSHQTTLGGSLQKQLSKANLGLNASTGKGYWQTSGNVQGALAVHSGGVTFGPYLGETFALVEAKGAEGAKLFNSSQLEIDDNGYALVPSVTPYRYNNISIDPQGMEGNAEVLDSQKRIIPVAGSSVKVKFRTRLGTALLIKAIPKNGVTIPMGAEVYDEQNQSIGLAGQGGQIYVRVEQPEGKLTVRWGEGSDYCVLPYAIKESDKKTALVNITADCNTL
ncbi:outer membrane usher protein [Klebsiella sp. BIGb0407]|nr:fimbria/pilus outer membrane usher protein [Klebsiella sp. BIGb0407]MCS3429830.1 outer membrane usher protein [Klebsiella sp. BIGb0407]